jgi:hypothetical protein
MTRLSTLCSPARIILEIARETRRAPFPNFASGSEEAVTMRLTLPKAALLASFGVLQILDVVTTNRVLGNGGWEGNPLSAFVISFFGGYWALPKLGLMAVCAAVMIRWNPRHIVPFVALMGVVVANNAFWAYS